MKDSVLELELKKYYSSKAKNKNVDEIVYACVCGNFKFILRVNVSTDNGNSNTVCIFFSCGRSIVSHLLLWPVSFTVFHSIIAETKYILQLNSHID